MAMGIGIYAASLGAIQEAKSLDVIANNLANAATPGYKKDGIHFSNFMSQATHIQMDQGRVRPTGNLMDIALDGNGYLRVQSPDGVLYTRAGTMILNRDNVLATQEGWPVLGKNGPIRVERAGEVRIEQDGQVFDKEDKIDVLDVVRFQQGTGLEKAKNGYFKPVPESAEIVPAEGCTVMQGSLEEPNFSVVEEMAHMIETMRTFEAYQKTMQMLEQADSQITNKLGNL